MAFGRRKQNASNRYADEVIIGDTVYSVHKLRKKARHATTMMFASVLVTVLMASLVVPYLAMAATQVSNSSVFTGTVIPGYSIGGLSISAYGVDLNSWANPSSSDGEVVATNYGIWSKDKASTAQSKLATMKNTDPEKFSSANKSLSWLNMTGSQNYTTDNPNGLTKASSSTDTVSPYRTSDDFNYWNSQTSTSTADSASISVSLMPEFVVISKDPKTGHAVVTSNPDDTSTTNASSQSMILSGSSDEIDESTTASQSDAIPYYISLNTLFSAYGLTSTSDTFDTLMDAIGKDTGNGYSPILDSVVGNDDNNLLYGTHYSALNSSSGNSSDAFNPYPYCMVFSKSIGSSTVVSSMYENDEAYVYFSPSSMYSTYCTLKDEYESLVSSMTTELDKSDNATDPKATITLGYYQAAMSICEAYLSEALPQDMTRGYVGPVENYAVTGSASSGYAGDESVSIDDLGVSDGDTNSFKKFTYSTLSYDIANQLVKDKKASGRNYSLAQTNATMDTLSTFGYGITTNVSQTGVMCGMDAAETYNRMNAFTAYSNDASSDSNDCDSSTYMKPFSSSSTDSALKSQKNTGIYVSPYYPIQQHCIPQTERNYRFSIVNTIPLATLEAYLSKYGFSAGTTSLSYSSGTFDAEDSSYSTLPTDTEKTALQNLIGMYQTNSGNNVEDQSPLTTNTYDTSESAVLHPKSASVSDTSSSNSESTTAERVDSALMNYSNSSMTADNVHDLADVIRSTGGLKYETFMRNYNPLKSSGADPDVYLTRVSPANNSYMPSVLLQGYAAAGGSEIANGTEKTTSAAYDYFSIPSFAPCFAGHTASDCYYGSLNYELRAFLQTGFLSTLNTGKSGINIPAVTAASKVQQEASDLSSKEVIDSDKMKTNIQTIFSDCQRLSYLYAVQQLNSGGTISRSDLYNYYSSAISSSIPVLASNASDAGYSSAWTSEAAGTGNSEWLASNIQNASFSGGYADSDNILSTDAQNIKLDVDIKATNISTASGLLNIVQFMTNNDYLFRAGWTPELFDYCACISDTFQDNPFFFSNDLDKITRSGSAYNTIFSYYYRTYLMSLLTTGGEYCWTNEGNELKSLRNWTGVWNVFDTQKENNSSDFFTKLGENSNDKELSDSLSTIQSDMSTAETNLFSEVQNFYNTLNGLGNSMPSQMQNAIAWADYSNSTNSQNAYQTPPSEATTTLTVQTGDSTASSSNSSITNLADCKKMGTKLDDNNALVPDSSSSATSMQASTVPGVEGTDSTASGNPASYTTTAIVARTQKMSSSSTTYPYSGLASSSLIQGCDRYVQMQSHVIDYTNIANGLNDDLSNFVETTAVTTDIEKSGESLLDMTGLGQILEFFQNLAYSIVKSGADLLKSQMYGTSSSSTSTATYSSKTAANADTMSSLNNAISATYGGLTTYSAAASIDHVNMNRTKLDTTVYNGTNPSSSSASSNNVSKASYSSTSVANAATNNDGNASTSSKGDSSYGTAGAYAINVFMHNDAGITLYKFMQSIGLLCVMLALLVIAFQNLLVYTNGDSSQFLNAQTNLKTTLPRAIFAVLMIGLPPIGGGQGFQGCGFLLLEAINSILTQIGAVFSNIEGTGLLDMTCNGFKAICSDVSNPFVMMLAILIPALIIFLCNIIMSIFIFLLNILLLLFFLLSPIAWGYYVWPYSIQEVKRGDSENITGDILNRATGLMGLSMMSNNKVGSQAAYGFVSTFVQTDLLFVMFKLVMWLISYVFVGTAGDSWTDNGAIGSSISPATMGDVGAAWWLALLNALAMLIMWMLMKKLLEGTFAGSAADKAKQILGSVAFGVKGGTGAVGAISGAVQAAKLGASIRHMTPEDAAKVAAARVKTMHPLDSASIASQAQAQAAPSIKDNLGNVSGNVVAANEDTAAPVAARGMNSVPTNTLGDDVPAASSSAKASASPNGKAATAAAATNVPPKNSTKSQNSSAAPASSKRAPSSALPTNSNGNGGSLIPPRSSEPDDGERNPSFLHAILTQDTNELAGAAVRGVAKAQNAGARAAEYTALGVASGTFKDDAEAHALDAGARARDVVVGVAEDARTVATAGEAALTTHDGTHHPAAALSSSVAAAAGISAARKEIKSNPSGSTKARQDAGMAANSLSADGSTDSVHFARDLNNGNDGIVQSMAARYSENRAVDESNAAAVREQYKRAKAEYVPGNGRKPEKPSNSGRATANTGIAREGIKEAAKKGYLNVQNEKLKRRETNMRNKAIDGETARDLMMKPGITDGIGQSKGMPSTKPQPQRAIRADAQHKRSGSDKPKKRK